LELKRFDEQVRNTKFDQKVGKMKYQMQQKLPETLLNHREGTTYDAEG
jgi:hypothetical protein